MDVISISIYFDMISNFFYWKCFSPPTKVFYPTSKVFYPLSPLKGNIYQYSHHTTWYVHDSYISKIVKSFLPLSTMGEGGGKKLVLWKNFGYSIDGSIDFPLWKHENIYPIITWHCWRRKLRYSSNPWTKIDDLKPGHFQIHVDYT